MLKGSCLCKAVSIEVDTELSEVEACHCSKCRKFSGHIGATTEIPLASLVIYGEEQISWYVSSEKARRGFCSCCGSSLFFDPLDKTKHDWIGVYMGVFDTPTNTAMGLHIFVGDKGDYYQIDDDLPQNIN